MLLINIKDRPVDENGCIELTIDEMLAVSTWWETADIESCIDELNERLCDDEGVPQEPLFLKDVIMEKYSDHLLDKIRKFDHSDYNEYIVGLIAKLSKEDESLRGTKAAEN